jgi:hypothetical protein
MILLRQYAALVVGGNEAKSSKHRQAAADCAKN